MASQSYSKFVIGGSGRHEGVIKSKVSKKELISWQANDNYIRFTCMLLTNYSGGLIKNKSSEEKNECLICILYLVFCILYAYLEDIRYDISTRNHGSSQYKLATS